MPLCHVQNAKHSQVSLNSFLPVVCPLSVHANVNLKIDECFLIHEDQFANMFRKF